MASDRPTLESRWLALCAVAKLVEGDPAEAGRWLLDAYSATGRAYHNLDHLAHCLAQFDVVRAQAADPVIAELAIWFHDSVYDPDRADNEQRSADWARSVLAFLGAEPGVIAAVQVIVLATRHAEMPNSGDGPRVADAGLVVDIDLSILGQPADAFEAYERAIREEYRHVHDEGFRTARAGILGRLLERQRIYSTLAFRARYETSARANLRRSIARLTAPPALRVAQG